MRIQKIAKSERGIFEPVKSEEHIVREIIDMLTLNGVTVYRVTERIPRRDAYGRIRGRISDPGIPDLLLLIPPNTLEVTDESL